VRIGWQEILLLLVILVLLFGAKKLPELARALGKSVSEFKKGKEEGEEEKQDVSKPDPSGTKPAGS
jgi:sec-independent protein translocase protein TatA